MMRARMYCFMIMIILGVILYYKILRRQNIIGIYITTLKFLKFPIAVK